MNPVRRRLYPDTGHLLALYFASMPAPLMTLAELDKACERGPYRRHGGDDRGNTRNRRVRKLWLLATFGDGEHCSCTHCGAQLDFATVTADRIVPGHRGGRYVRGNIRPSCAPCANRQGADITNGVADPT